jgi:c-di-GMP-related signal transduction protein
MGIPMEEILKGINLAPAMQRALETAEGTLGALLTLAQALESGDGVSCHEQLAKLPGLNPTMVNAHLTEALCWANSINQEHE